MGDARVPLPPWPDDEFVDYAQARQHALLRAAYLVCGDLRLAEDLLRDAFVQLARQWGRVREEQPDLFVRRILYREAVASWRKRPHEAVAADARRRGSLGLGRARRAVGRRGRRASPRGAARPGRPDPEAAGRRRAQLVRGAWRGRGRRGARAAPPPPCGRQADEALTRPASGPATGRPEHRRRAMTADLRELLELASDDVPDLDLASEAVGGGRAAAPGRGAAHRDRGRRCGGAGCGSFVVACATGPGRGADPDGRAGHRRRGRAAARRRRSATSPCTSRPTRRPRPSCRATPGRRAARSRGTSARRTRRSGPGSARAGCRVRRAAAGRVPRRRGGRRLPPGPLRAGRAVRGRGARRAGQPVRKGVQSALGPGSISDDRHRVVIPAARPGAGARRPRRVGARHRGARPDPLARRAGPVTAPRSSPAGATTGWLVDVPTGTVRRAPAR